MTSPNSRVSRRVGAIQGVKRDIQQMAINSSLRSNRLGDIGLSENQIRDNLMFTADKVGEPMRIAMQRADAGLEADRAAKGGRTVDRARSLRAERDGDVEIGHGRRRAAALRR